MSSTTVRVAAAQFATGTDIDENLASHVRLVGAAADEGAQLVVTPEFGNHLSVYESPDHAWDVAVDLDGPYVAALAALADDRDVWLAASATVRRDAATRTLDLPWGRLAVLVGDDHHHPEAVRLAALASADVGAVVTGDLEPWERAVGFASRAAENRVDVVVGATNGGLLVELPTDFTLWTPSDRPFDGRINDPTVHAGPTAVLRPSAAANRLVSKGTDVVDGRPWRLLDVLVDT